MFQNLRGGMPFYILYKNEPKLSVGEVVSVGKPMQKFGTVYENGIMSLPKYELDVKVSIAGEVVELKQLPAEQSIADFGTSGMVVSDNKDAILNEIDAFESFSQRALNDVERHKRNIEECGRMKSVLNPQIAKEAEQAREIETLKNDMADIKAMLSKVLKGCTPKS